MIINLIKGIIGNKTAQLFVVINIILWSIALWDRGSVESSGFHFYYESLLLQILLLVNFPALVCTGIIIIPLIFLGFRLEPNETTIYIQILIFLFCSSIQWGLIGYWIDRVFLSKCRVVKLN